ncbi:MAG TPA: hypothetical protein VKU36_02915 [Candidatus Babeliales bacterium]|nr:hypothetical protein [Candidatus Babeliales bacterium]
MKHIRFLAMIVVCINPITVIASDYRNLPVPPLYGASAGIGFVNGGDNLRAIDKMFSFVNHKQQIIMLATGIVVLSIIYYMYKQNTVGNVKKAALEEMNAHIEALQKKMSSCIDNIPAPEAVKKYLKESMVKSIAEYIANIHNSSVRYIKKNKKYFISLTAAPIGMALSYPVTGGAVAMLGIVYGAIQSAREEIAEFRAETEKLFAETNKNIKDGFENSDKKAEENKEAVLTEIKSKTEELSEKIETITTHIDQLKTDLGNKVDGIDDKVDSLSQKLGTITVQMISLHTKIDERNGKDSQKDEQMNELFEQLEVVTQKFDTAKECFIQFVSTMIEESAQKTETEFKIVNEEIAKIDQNQIGHAHALVSIQEKIGHLLDQHESDEKKFIEILDSVKSTNLSLEEIKQTATHHKDLFTNLFENIQKKINENKEDLLNTIEQTIKECSSLSHRMSQLELKVEKDQKYNKEMFERLSEQNDKLKEQIALLIKRDQERENKLNAWQESDKKDKENLRKDLKTVAGQIINQVDGVKEEIQRSFHNIKDNVTQQIMYVRLPSLTEEHYGIKKKHGLKKQKGKQNLPLTNQHRTQAEKEINELLNIQ